MGRMAGYGKDGQNGGRNVRISWEMQGTDGKEVRVKVMERMWRIPTLEFSNGLDFLVERLEE